MKILSFTYVLSRSKIMEKLFRLKERGTDVKIMLTYLFIIMIIVGAL